MILTLRGNAWADTPVINVATGIASFANLGSPVQVGFGARTLYTIKINNTQSAATTYVQLFNSATTPTLGTSVVDQATCPAASYCFVVLGGGEYFPAGAWIGASTAISGSTAASSGNYVYVGYQ